MSSRYPLSAGSCHDSLACSRVDVMCLFKQDAKVATWRTVEVTVVGRVPHAGPSTACATAIEHKEAFCATSLFLYTHFIMSFELNPLLSLPPALELGIAPRTAHALAFVFASSYVGSLYLAPYLVSPRRRGSAPDGKTTSAADAAQRLPPGHRDHPDTMRLRMSAVGLATRLCLIGVYTTVKIAGNYTIKEAVGSTSTGMTDI